MKVLSQRTGLLNGAKDNNFQPPRAKIKVFNLQKQEKEPSTFKSKNKNLQKKTKTFNLFKSENKNLQPFEE
jgi:cell shape-determining protein MreC